MDIYNIYIYFTANTLTITCQGNKEPYIVQIKNQGLIKLNQECRAYAEIIVLNPTREIKSKHYINFIPKIGVSKLPTKLIRVQNIKMQRTKFDSHKLEWHTPWMK